MKSLYLDIILVLALCIQVSCSNHRVEDTRAQLRGISDPTETSNYRGWNYLVSKLIARGIDKAQVEATYLDARMPEYNLITFKMKPGESADIYNGFTNNDLIEKAREFLRENANDFAHAEKKYAVNRYIITAIFLVETRLGTATGNHLVLNRLSRLSSIAEPKNVEDNFKILQVDNKDLTLDQAMSRARSIEAIFENEIPALFEMARTQGIDLFQLNGSSAGAFGIPQFLPSSYLKYAVDGNLDGKISLFDVTDSIFSTANYLSSFGWKDSANTENKRKVLWNYNHSHAYIDTLLKVSILLRQKRNYED